MDYKKALFQVITDRPDLKIHIMHIFLSAGTTVDELSKDHAYKVDWEFIYKEVMKVATELDSKT